MNREVGNRTWWMVLGTFVLLAVALSVSAGFAQQGSEGPNQDAGEVVLAPRRPANTRPAPIEPIERPEKIDIDSTFSMSVSTNLVNMDVVVTDKYGNFIPTLKQGNFRLYEDGVEQSITNFSRSKGAMTVCMLIEFRNTRLWWNLYEAIRSSYQFVNFLQPDDYVAVVAYDLHPEVLTDFTQNRNQIIQALNRLRVPGFSEANLYDSLEFAIESMKDIKTKKAILLITTGIDTFSKMTYGKALKMVSVNDEERVLAEVEVIRQRTERGIEQTEESLKAEREVHEATRKKLAAKDEEWQEKLDDLGKEHGLETIEMRKVHQAILAQKDEEIKEAVHRAVEEQESEFATRMETRLADELDGNQKNREEEVAKLQDQHTVEIDELKEKYETFIGKLTSEVDQHRDVAASREQDQETLLQRREVLESRVEELESALKHAQLQAEQALSLALLELENKLNAEKSAALADAEAEWRGKLDSEAAHLHTSLSDAGEQKKLENASALSQLASQIRQEKSQALEEAESKWKNKLAEVESQWKEILEEVQQERETAVASLRDEYAQNLTHLQQNQQETTTATTQEAEDTQKQLEEEVAGLRTVTEQLEQDLLRTQSQFGESQQKVAEKDKTISSLKAARDNLTRAVEAYQQDLEERGKSGVRGIVKGIFSK